MNTSTTEKNRKTSQTKGARFQQSDKLCDADSFSHVFKKPQRSRDKMFIVLYQQNNRDAPRLGMAISKRKCSQATTRNRLKRVIRESFRLNKEKIGDLDIVVLNRSAAATTDNKALFDSLGKHWLQCQSGLVKNERQQ